MGTSTTAVNFVSRASPNNVPTNATRDSEVRRASNTPSVASNAALANAVWSDSFEKYAEL